MSGRDVRARRDSDSRLAKANLCAGYNYAETSFGDDEVSADPILPAIVETHYTIGADYRFNRHWELGFRYMFAA